MKNNILKAFVIVISVLALLGYIAIIASFGLSSFLSVCSSFGWGSDIPPIYTDKAFENDTWLVTGSRLINKDNGKIYLLKPDPYATIPEIDNIYYHGPYAYKYEFGESEFKQYTFLRTNYYSDNTGDPIYKFYNCVFTYSYEGRELERSYIGEALTEEEMEEVYKTNPSNIENFTFEIDILWDNKKREYKNSTQQMILEYAESIYKKQNNEHSTVVGLAKTMGDSTYFSIVVSKDAAFNTGDPMIPGIHIAQINSYNPDSNQFETIYNHRKKGEAIVDFDEHGVYLLDSWYNLKYFNFKTKKTTTIYRSFQKGIHYIDIYDDYICISYGSYSKGSYFVYQKGGKIIADELYS